MKDLIKFKPFLIGFSIVFSLFILIHLLNFFMIWGYWRYDADNYQTSISDFARYDFGFPFEFFTWWSPTYRQFNLENFLIDISGMLAISIVVGLISQRTLSKPNFEDYSLKSMKDIT